jgi:hypothetical protein
VLGLSVLVGGILAWLADQNHPFTILKNIKKSSSRAQDLFKIQILQNGYKKFLRRLQLRLVASIKVAFAT